ncbi:MAG: hypothetical protein ABIH50_08330 [bacterium]
MKKCLIVALIAFTALIFAKVSFAQEAPIDQPKPGQEMAQPQRPGPGGQPWLAQYIGSKVKFVSIARAYAWYEFKGELQKVEISGIVVKDITGWPNGKEAFFPFGTIVFIQPVSD